MTDTYTPRQPIRVVDLTSQYQGKWFVQTKENDCLYLTVHCTIANCLDDDIIMDELYFHSKEQAKRAIANYIYGGFGVPVQRVTGDVESQVMEF